MAVRPITIWGEPVLHRRASEVTEFDGALRALIEDMHETNEAAHGVGLAAPQIGVGLRVFVYKFNNDDGVPPRGVVVNPRLTLSKVPGAAPDPEEDELSDLKDGPHRNKPLSPPGRGLLGLLLARYGAPGAPEPETYAEAYDVLQKHGLGLFYPKAD